MFLGIVGRRGAGKDATAQAVIDTAAKVVLKTAWAQPLKQMLYEAFRSVDPQAHDALWGDSTARERQVGDLTLASGEPLTYRYALQTLGTEWGRQTIHPDVWVALGMARARRKIQNHPGFHVVFTDTRFINEASAIRAEGGQVWRVRRPEVEAVPVDNHASEAAIDSTAMDWLVTHEIANGGSLDDLRTTVAGLVQGW